MYSTSQPPNHIQYANHPANTLHQSSFLGEPNQYVNMDVNPIEKAEMMAGHEEEMIWEPEHPPSNLVHYLAVDTNVFISHLNLIRTIHNLLLGIKPSPVILLIPSVVIHELDGLKNSRTPSEPGSTMTLGRLVQSANTWLLEIHRNRRLTGNGALRCQSLVERWDTTIRAHGGNDDEILDCCLHFSNNGSKVTLWTNDKNLSVKAESNDISTLGGPNVTLSTLFRSLNEDLPSTLWEEINRLSNFESPPSNLDNTAIERKVHELDYDMDMEGDHELSNISHTRTTEHNHDTPEITSILHQPQAQRRYPYLLPSTNPEHASVPTSTTPSIPPIFPSPSLWHSMAQSATPTPAFPSSTQLTVTSHHQVSTLSFPASVHSPTPTMDTNEFPTDSNSHLTNLSNLQHTTPARSRQSSPTKNSASTTAIPSSTANRTSPSPSRPSSANPNKYSTSISIPFSASTSTSKGPSPILLTSIQLSLRPYLVSLLQQIPDQLHPLPIGDRITTDQILPTLSNTLTALDQRLKNQGDPPTSDIRLSLIRSIGATKTITNYIDNYSTSNLGKGIRKVRSGEVVQSLFTLNELFRQLSLDSTGDNYMVEVIDEIRKLD